MTDSSFHFSRIIQTILKLDSQIFHCPVLLADISPLLLESWERLIDIVAQLLSPGSGWPDELPPTPENLATYITEEADEVLAIIHREMLERNENSPPPLSDYITLEELLPRLLWYLARSSDEMMQLLAGLPAQIKLKNSELEDGNLRLSTILTLDNRADWAIDLVTNHLPQSTLSAQTLINSLEGFTIPEPITCSHFLDQLREKILKINPELKYFFSSNHTEFLEPGFPWQSGSFQIKFTWEFIKFPDLIPEGEFPSPNPLNSPLPAKLRLTHQPLLEAYFESVMKQQLIQGMIEVISSEHLKNFEQDLGSFNPGIFCLIEAAYEFVEAIQNPQKFDQLNSLGQEILIKDLTQKLLWQIIRPHWEIMQWVGGVKVNVLPPESPWIKGLLHLTLTWQLQLSESLAKIDLVSGELFPPFWEEIYQENIPNKFRLTQDTIIQLQSSEITTSPIRADDFLRKIQDKLESVSPELALWLMGIEIDFHLAPNPSLELENIHYVSWDSGISQLQLGLELTLIE